jgi:hypothetical protein
MPPLMSRVLPALAVLLLTAPSADAAQRWASPDSTVTDGACSASHPCRLEAAVNGAATGDEVVVAPGTYVLTTELSPAAIDLRGAAGWPRPRIRGGAAAGTSVLSFKAGGTLRHLAIEATASGQDALQLRTATGEDLLLTSATGDGAKVVGSAAGTVLRDSVVYTAATGSGSAGLKLRESGGSGDVALRNVTVMAPAGKATGIRCEVKSGQATLVNAIVHGAGEDVDAGSSAGHCTARSSNFRPALSPGLVAGSGNQDAAPRFVDAPGGDFRPAAGSPTIDAGESEGLIGSADPAGCTRSLDLAPDIGAYEYAGPLAPCAAAAAEPVLPGPPLPDEPETGPGATTGGEPTIDEIVGDARHPVIGANVVVAAGRGKIRIKRPGSERFRPLEAATRIPVGSVVDASAGQVQLVSAIDAAGTLQTGTFWGTRFAVRQSRNGNGMTTLVLRGGDFGICRPSAGTATISRKARKVRSLWGKDSHGRYRTHGQNSVATARGTRWLTEDRCDGTLTRVTSGAVAVRDRARGRTVLVKAGGSYLARHKR